MKKIWDYFEDNVEYPSEIIHNPIPYGTVWTYVSSTFLNGLINYCEPVSCFVLNKYRSDDELVSGRIELCNKGEFGNWEKFIGTKRELINVIKSGKKEVCHTNLSCFTDDIIILGEFISNEKDNLNRFIFFWYDYDVSDCSVGKFETTDSKEVVIESIKNWLNKESKDKSIVGFDELPLSFVRGWVSF